MGGLSAAGDRGALAHTAPALMVQRHWGDARSRHGEPRGSASGVTWPDEVRAVPGLVQHLGTSPQRLIDFEESPYTTAIVLGASGEQELRRHRD